MTSLSDIEAAIERLPPQEQQHLLLFLAARLRGQIGQLPAPRQFSAEQMPTWLKEDREHAARRL